MDRGREGEEKKKTKEKEEEGWKKKEESIYAPRIYLSLINNVLLTGAR